MQKLSSDRDEALRQICDEMRTWLFAGTVSGIIISIALLFFINFDAWAGGKLGTLICTTYGEWRLMLRLAAITREGATTSTSGTVE